MSGQLDPADPSKAAKVRQIATEWATGMSGHGWLLVGGWLVVGGCWLVVVGEWAGSGIVLLIKNKYLTNRGWWEQ